MKSIVINRCYGGFGLSYAGVMEYARIKGIKLYAFGSKELGQYVLYSGEGKEPFIIHYSTDPVGDLRNPEKRDCYFSVGYIERDDPALVEVVRNLGEKSWGMFAELKIVEIPDDVDWEIDEYDGMESVEEKHNSWN